MIAFVISATLLTLTALALLYFLWQRQGSGEASRRSINAAIYRDQITELERDRREGLLAEEDHQNAVAELERRLIEDGASEDGTPAPATARSRPIALFAGIALAAVGLYLLLGQPAAIAPPPAEPRFTAEEIDAMVAKLAARLEREPDNLQGWTMLARSYKVLGRYEEAARAYERAEALVSKDASLMLDQADILATLQGNLDGKPRALIRKALEIEPEHPQGLWLAGADDFESGRYAEAIGRWEKLLALLPPQAEEEAASLRQAIDKARRHQQSGDNK